MGHYLSKDMSSENVVKALQQAVKNKMSNQSTIHHSDRGLQRSTPDITQRYTKKNCEKIK
jgi:hypothetical protein